MSICDIDRNVEESSPHHRQHAHCPMANHVLLSVSLSSQILFVFLSIVDVERILRRIACSRVCANTIARRLRWTQRETVWMEWQVRSTYSNWHSEIHAKIVSIQFMATSVFEWIKSTWIACPRGYMELWKTDSELWWRKKRAEGEEDEDDVRNHCRKCTVDTKFTTQATKQRDAIERDHREGEGRPEGKERTESATRHWRRTYAVAFGYHHHSMLYSRYRFDVAWIFYGDRGCLLGNGTEKRI